MIYSHAGTRPLVTRLADGDLFYHLNDPTGTSLVLADETGAAAGRMVYDAYGGVLSDTLPLTLSGTLADVPDAATGLVHLGGGRYYDPTLGRPLQPNPAGGPPAAPQALNRYAATLAGQPGVMQAAQGDGFNWTPHVIGLAKNTAVELARDIPVVKGYTYAGVRRVAVSGSYETLTQNLPDALRQFPGRLVGTGSEGPGYFYLTRIQVEAESRLGIGVSAERVAQELTERLPADAHVQLRGGLGGNYWPDSPVTGQLDEILDLNAFGFGLDFAIGFGFQYAEDIQNPYLTRGQAFLRAGTSGFGSATVSLIAVSMLCGGPACAVVIGIGGGLVWTHLLQPIVFQVPAFQPAQRKLLPLTTP